jgi:hypothetical protein
MRSPHSFIIRPEGGSKYSSIKKINGEDIVMSATIEDASYTNRYAQIVSTPSGYVGDIEDGATIITHHNTFRTINNMLGNEEASSAFIKDDMYFIDYDTIYMYKNTGKEWIVNSPYCFVKPVDKIQGFLLSIENYEKQHGIIKFAPQGSIEIGQYIVFSPDSEYEFDIDGELLYRMKLNDICLILNQEY